MDSKNNIGAAMLPITVRGLADMVMKKKSLPMEDALHYIYSSELYQTLLDEKAKLWYDSTLSLYEALEKEKAKKRKASTSDKVLLFHVFCIENYREKTGESPEVALLQFSKHGVFNFLNENFEMLHTQDTDYIIETILKQIKV